MPSLGRLAATRCRRATRRRPGRSPGRGRRSRRGRRRRARSARTASAPARAARPGRRPRRRARLAAGGGGRHADARARRRVAQRVLDQVDRQAVQLVARRLDDGRLRVEHDLVVAADRAQLARGLDDDLREVARLAAARRARRRCARAAAGRRPAGASAARSAAPSARRRPRRRRSDSASSSRFASTLVSGVRSSCEASATNWRWRASIASVSPRAASSSRSIPSQRARQLGDLVVGLAAGARSREGSRVRAISAAVEVSSAIGAIARRAIAIPASSARPVPSEHAEQQEQLDARDRRLGVGDRRPYWMITWPIGSSLPDTRTIAGAADARGSRARSWLHAGRAERGRFGRFLGDDRAAEREDADDGVVGRCRVGGERRLDRHRPGAC